MHRLLRTTILITFVMFIICIIGGCGDDDSPEEVTDTLLSEVDGTTSPTITVIVDPAPSPGVFFHISTEFTLKFSEEVVEVTVNDTPASGSGLNWKWSAYPGLPHGSVKLKNGSVKLKIKWTNRDGSGGFATSGPYEVADNEEPPTITAGTVSDGAADVNPAPINAAGFRYDFNELVTGTIRLADEAGANLNWIGIIVGQTATLTPAAGQELVNETTYRIEINVQDGIGNSLQTTMTFVTKPK